MDTLLIAVIVVFVLSSLVLFSLYSTKSKEAASLTNKIEHSSKKLNTLNKRIVDLESKIAELKFDNAAQQRNLTLLSLDKADLEDEKAAHQHNLSLLLANKKESMPWLAGMIADFMTYDLEIEAKKLDWGSNIQREKKIASLREIRADAKARIQANQEALYQLAYLRELYPAIDDVLDSEYSELSVSSSLPDSDPVRRYLSKEEWRSLPQDERDQLALDRYVESHSKSKWQIGRDYELSVAYEYSKKGYRVDTYGSHKGLEDLGRDIIATKPGIILIIQCKYWSESKTIHEKHIYQLYGTTISYCIENDLPLDAVHGVFVTNIILSDVAKQAAKHLGISFVEHHQMVNFPRIKCNIGRDEHGRQTKIYHLPMDDQYDTTKIDSPGECYAYTVKEAVERGFRRAYKWHNN